MHISEPSGRIFFCEVCEEAAVNPVAMGINSDGESNALIQLCRDCGPIDLELMQICRETTIRCRDN